MATVELNGAAITDAESFHVESQRAFGFPDSYPHTMDSWVDCLSYLRDEDGMSSVRLKKDEVLHIVVRTGTGRAGRDGLVHHGHQRALRGLWREGGAGARIAVIARHAWARFT